MDIKGDPHCNHVGTVKKHHGHYMVATDSCNLIRSDGDNTSYSANKHTDEHSVDYMDSSVKVKVEKHVKTMVKITTLLGGMDSLSHG